MSSLSVKYRPTSFEDCCGQRSVITILNKQLELNKIKNCYLFSGASGCVDRDTEYFTGMGWKKIGDYSIGDKVLQYTEDGKAELVIPENYIKLPCKELSYVHTKYGVDMCLSDEHTVVYQTSRGNLATKPFIEFKEWLNKSDFAIPAKLYTTFDYTGVGIDLTDTEIKLMCAVICDGYFDKHHSSNWCTFNLKKQRKIDELRNILTEGNYEYTETYHRSTGYTRFYVTVPRAEKEFSDYWYNCNHDQLQLICDNVLKWDGCTINRMSFSSTSKQSVDFIQFAFAACGYRTSIWVDDRVGKKKRGSKYSPKSVAYELLITKQNMIGFGKFKDRVENYPTKDGFKYCFTVPSHMWVMRRNGHIIVTGNCGKTTLARILASKINHGGGTPIEIDAASNNGVDKVREIVKHAEERALDCEYKVIIIDESHVLTKQAWDAFLKCIEEPPKYTVFMFCTTDPQKIPEAVLNRMMRFNITKLPSNTIAERLGYICKQEGFQDYSEAIEYISKICNGSMREAISLLEKAADYDTNLHMENICEALGRVPYEVYCKLINAIIDGDEVNTLQYINEIYYSGVDLKLFIDQLLRFCLDISKYILLHSFEVVNIPCDLKDAVDNSINFDGANKYYQYFVNKLLQLKTLLKEETDLKTTVEVYLLSMCQLR